MVVSVPFLCIITHLSGNVSTRSVPAVCSGCRNLLQAVISLFIGSDIFPGFFFSFRIYGIKGWKVVCIYVLKCKCSELLNCSRGQWSVSER